MAKRQRKEIDPTDYVGRAIAYAERAIDTKNKQFGRWIRLAAHRFLDDLERAQHDDAPFYFDEWHGNDICDFIEKLPHVEGRWKNADGTDQPFIRLHDSDVFFLVQLFGFRKPDGTRRFTNALKAIARKNAKSTIAAAVGIYCQNCEGEMGPQIITGATTGAQARIVFNIAKRMVEMSPDLQEAFNVEAFANGIASYKNGGTFKPINAKASTQDGLNPSCVILDEIHAHKDHDLLNVLRSAAGARANPLFLFTTTEGYESPGPWPELRHFGQQVLMGLIEADHFLVIIYAVDEKDDEAGIRGDDDFDETAWIKANPLMEVNPLLLQELRKEAIEAKGMPGRHAEFKIKRLNRASSVAGGWVNLSKWKECDKPMLPDAILAKHPCSGGLDLASTTDMASFRLTWLIDGEYVTKGWRFIPEQAIRRRKTRGLIPYEAWVNAGLLIPCGNESIDYDVIYNVILEVSERYNIINIAYDKWNASQLVGNLEKAGLPMSQFIQGPISYHPAMKELERAYLAAQLVHGSDPVLNWCASNVVARTDVNLNMAPDRKKAKEKIDDFVALLMSIGMIINPGEKEPEKKYQMLFV